MTKYQPFLAAQTAQAPAFEPLPKQRAIHDSTAAENLYSGAVGAGKTRTIMEKAHQLALKYAGLRVGVFRKVRATLLETTIYSYLCHVNGWQSIDDDYGSYGAIKRWFKSELRAVYNNGSQVMFFGLDKISKIGSLEIGAAFIDEAQETEEADWDMVQTRLRQPVLDKAQLFAACNPASPSHYLYQKFFKNPNPDCFAIQTKSYENPYLPDEYLERLGRLTGLFYRRMVEGEWVGYAGIIYDCFDPDKHIVDTIPAEANRTYRSLDFGGINPYVCQWWKVTPDNKMYLDREIYWSGISANDFARKIVENQPKTERIDGTISDHDASDRLELLAHGIRTSPARKDVKLGIEKTYEKLANNEIFFKRDAVIEKDWQLVDDSGMIKRKRPQSTVDEISSYEWNITQAGMAKDEPLKRDDHGMDSLRYMVSALANPTQRRAYSARGI